MSKIAVVALAALATTPSLALDEPVLWRDPDTACGYWITPGAMTPRLRRDGSHDCPGNRIIANGPVAAIDESEVKDATIRDLVQAVERLQREVKAIRREAERPRWGPHLRLPFMNAARRELEQRMRPTAIDDGEGGSDPH